MLNTYINNSFKIKRQIDGKVYIYYYCIYCGFIMIEAIDEKEPSVF